MPTNQYQAELLRNRINKRYKHLLKWAKRNGIFAFRLYDKDIPEIPLAIDIYFENSQDTESNQVPNEEAYSADKIYLVMFLYKRPYEKSIDEETEWINCISDAISELLNISKNRIFFKMREKQKGSAQYNKLDSARKNITVKEGNCLFSINLSDYLDTGLFLDHRPSRLKIAKEAKNKAVLNLYAYTGAFSIHALDGGARKVESVDLSNTYLNIAKENLKINKLDESKAIFTRSCVIKFLEESQAKKKKWDIIICDPPTFSNSKQADTFDINKDWKKLCALCIKVLDKNGTLYFSSNSLKLKFSPEELIAECKQDLKINDISPASIPEDFRNKKIHKMWEIKFL